MAAMMGAKGSISNRETQYGAGTFSKSSPEICETFYFCSINKITFGKLKVFQVKIFRFEQFETLVNLYLEYILREIHLTSEETTITRK